MGRRHGQLLAEEGPENQPGQRAAEQQLPDEGHGHVAAPGVDPHAEAGLLEEQGGNEAHGGAHQAHDHGRDGVGDDLGAICGAHHGEGQLGGQLLHHEELQYHGDGDHDRHLVEGHEEGGVGHAAGVQGHIVHDHSVYHDDRHENGEYDALKGCLGHRCFSSPRSGILAQKKKESNEPFVSLLSFTATTSN